MCMQTKTFFNFKTYHPLYFTNTSTKIAKNLLADIIVFMEEKTKKAEELLNRALYYQSVYIQNLIIRQEYSKINHKNKRLKRYKKTVKPDPQYQKLLNRKIKTQNYIIETKITRNK